MPRHQVVVNPVGFEPTGFYAKKSFNHNHRIVCIEAGDPRRNFMKAQRTRSQERILRLLRELNRPISPQELYIELRDRTQGMGLATVYRSLEALKLGGAVQARTLANGESLYSLIKEDKHHLTCLQCGTSIPIEDCPVHELEAQLRQSNHFEIYYHTLEFFGVCPPCQLQVEVSS